MLESGFDELANFYKFSHIFSDKKKWLKRNPVHFIWNMAVEKKVVDVKISCLRGVLVFSFV